MLSPVTTQGSPPPIVIWLKDGIPTKGREIITKSKNHSQFLIKSTKCSDSGVYHTELQNVSGEVYHDFHVCVAGMTMSRGLVDIPAYTPLYCWSFTTVTAFLKVVRLLWHRRARLLAFALMGRVVSTFSQCLETPEALN